MEILWSGFMGLNKMCNSNTHLSACLGCAATIHVTRFNLSVAIQQHCSWFSLSWSSQSERLLQPWCLFIVSLMLIEQPCTVNHPDMNSSQVYARLFRPLVSLPFVRSQWAQGQNSPQKNAFCKEKKHKMDVTDSWGVHRQDRHQVSLT